MPARSPLQPPRSLPKPVAISAKRTDRRPAGTAFAEGAEARRARPGTRFADGLELEQNSMKSPGAAAVPTVVSVPQECTARSRAVDGLRRDEFRSPAPIKN